MLTNNQLTREEVEALHELYLYANENCYKAYKKGIRTGSVSAILIFLGGLVISEVNWKTVKKKIQKIIRKEKS